MSDFIKLLQEYKNLYTAWCSFGMPDGIIMWHQGRGGQGYTTRPGTAIDIHKCCEEGKYIDTSKPWLSFNKADDSITIYSMHYKAHFEVLLFEVHTSTFPKRELLDYAHQHSLKLDILLGRRPFETDKKKTVEVVVLQGKRSDFIKAEWENEWQEELRRKEQAVQVYREGCAVTRGRIAASLPMIQSAYDSAAMDAVAEYTPPYCNGSGLSSPDWDYTLYADGVMWHEIRLSTIAAGWFMRFSKLDMRTLKQTNSFFPLPLQCFAGKTE